MDKYYSGDNKSLFCKVFTLAMFYTTNSDFGQAIQTLFGQLLSKKSDSDQVRLIRTTIGGTAYLKEEILKNCIMNKPAYLKPKMMELKNRCQRDLMVWWLTYLMNLMRGRYRTMELFWGKVSRKGKPKIQLELCYVSLIVKVFNQQ